MRRVLKNFKDGRPSITGNTVQAKGSNRKGEQAIGVNSIDFQRDILIGQRVAI